MLPVASTFLDGVENASKAATCALLNFGSTGLYGLGVAAYINGPQGEEFLALAAAQGFQQLAAYIGCDYDPEGPAPPMGNEGNGAGKCWKIQPGTNPGLLTIRSGPNNRESYFGGGVQILGWTYRVIDGVQDRTVANVTVITEYGLEPVVFEPGAGAEEITAVYITLAGGSRCEANGPSSGTAEEPFTYQYTDATTECVYNLELEGFMLTPDGMSAPVWGVTSPLHEPTTRASGGRIAPPCNFAPTIYMDDGRGGGGGGGHSGPYPPTLPDGEPAWIKWARAALQGVAAGLTEEVLEQMIAALTPPEAAVTYNLTAVCPTDVDPEGNPWQCNYDIDAAKGTSALVQRLDALALMMQCDLGRQKFTCAGEKPEIKGQSVKVNFRSDAYSENGKNYLRKLFGYRSLGDSSAESLFGYWKDFTWEAGPVIVKHHDAWWGQIQVWALSEAEGKRVIRFAGVNAGINPDEEGTWKIQVATGSRNGRTGRMIIEDRGGQWGICARTGASTPTYWPTLVST